MGAWIETQYYEHDFVQYKSLPMWERGLKPEMDNIGMQAVNVAPHVGAWIETLLFTCEHPKVSRSPCGSVD